LPSILDGAPDLGTPGVRGWWAYAPKKPVMADWEKVKAKAMTKAAFAAKWGSKLIDVDHPDLGSKSNLLAVMAGDRDELIGERMAQARAWHHQRVQPRWCLRRDRCRGQCPLTSDDGLQTDVCRPRPLQVPHRVGHASR